MFLPFHSFFDSKIHDWWIFIGTFNSLLVKYENIFHFALFHLNFLSASSFSKDFQIYKPLWMFYTKLLWKLLLLTSRTLVMRSNWFRIPHWLLEYLSIQLTSKWFIRWKTFLNNIHISVEMCFYLLSIVRESWGREPVNNIFHSTWRYFKSLVWKFYFLNPSSDKIVGRTVIEDS